MKHKQQGMNQVKARSGLALALLATVLVTGCFDPSPEQYIKTGKSRLEKSDARGAAIEFKNALQKDPTVVEARFLLASALLKLGDAVGAAVELEKVEKAGYDNNVVAPLMARALMQQGKSDALLAKYKDTVLTQPAAMAELQIVLGRAHLALGRLDEARAAGKKALDAVPDSIEGQQLQARIVAAGGDLPSALEQTRALIAKRPKEHSNWLMLGDLQIYGGDARQARQSYDEAIKLNPAQTQGYFSLLPVLLTGGDFAAAANTLAAVEKLDAKNPLTQYFKAWLKMEQGDLKTAQEGAQNLLKQAPESVDVLYLRGAIEARKNSLERAVDYLGKAVNAAPTQVRPRVLLAQTQLRRGDAARALATLQPLLKQDEPPADILVLAASATTRLGDVDKSEKLLAQAVAVDPNNAAGRVGLALIRIDKGSVEVGLKMLREASKSTQSVSPDVALIETLVRLKKYDEANDAIQRLQEKPDGKLIADMQRGKLELDRSDAKQARNAFDSVLKLDAGNIPAIAALAGMDVLDKQPDKAQERFQKLLDKDPGNAAARSALLRLAVDRGTSNEELVSMAQKAVKAAPNSRDLRVAYVRLLIAKPDTKQAAEAAQEALNLLGDDPELLALLGQSQLANGDTNLAITNLTRLVTMRSSLPQPYLLLAGAYRKRGDFPQTVQTLKRGIEVAPDYALLYQSLAAAQSLNGQYAQALQTAKQWQARDKNGWVGYQLEGDVHLRQERLDAAADAYRTGVSKNAAPVLAMRLHQVLKKAGKNDAAAAFESKRLAEYPKDLNFINYLAESAMQGGQFEVAESRFRQALALEPSNPAILNNLAWVLGKRNNSTAALEFASRAVKLAPSRPEFLDTLAEVQAQAGRLDDAIDSQRQAVAVAPESHSQRLRLAEYLIKAGKKSEAKDELTRLSQLGSGFSRQAEVQRMLQGI